MADINSPNLHLDVDDIPRDDDDDLETVRVETVECTLVWRDLKYTIFETRFPLHKQLASIFPFIKPPKKSRILNGISGYAEPGKFLGIIGSSGAGKTSLLNVLSNSIDSGVIKGTIEANGASIKTTRQIPKYKRIVGYVLQQDALLPFLTVKETLFYAGMLTLPRTMSFLNKLEKIDALIFELGLDKCSDSYVGNSLIRGISGGEKKRLSIGIELLRDPAILFLDEPTSGLDARSALQLCKNLQRLATKYSHSVIAVIHQPRAQIFKAFDDILVLAPGGRQIYFGKADYALGYFSKHGFQCPERENPADYFVDQTTIDFTSLRTRNDSENHIQELAEKWNEHPEPECINDSGFEFVDEIKRPTLFWQSVWVSLRESINESRNRRYLITRFIQNFFIPLLLGCLLIRFGDDQTSIYERTGAIFFAILTISFNEMMAAMAVFISQRDVFYRERKAGLYSPTAYWIGKQIALLPYQLFFPAIWIFVIYFVSGFQLSWFKFSIFFGTLELAGLYGNSGGLLLGSSVPPTISTVIGPIYVMTSVFLAGFIINLENMSDFFFGLSFLSYARYAFECLIINEFTGLDFSCSSESSVNGGACTFRTGEEVIDSFHFAELSLFIYMIILLGGVIALRILLWVVLRFSRADLI